MTIRMIIALVFSLLAAACTQQKPTAEYVLTYAKAHGIKRVTSLESGDDRAAINLEREMGFVARLLCADPIEIGLSKAID